MRGATVVGSGDQDGQRRCIRRRILWGWTRGGVPSHMIGWSISGPMEPTAASTCPEQSGAPCRAAKAQALATPSGPWPPLPLAVLPLLPLPLLPLPCFPYCCSCCRCCCRRRRRLNRRGRRHGPLVGPPCWDWLQGSSRLQGSMTQGARRLGWREEPPLAAAALVDSWARPGLIKEAVCTRGTHINA